MNYLFALVLFLSSFTVMSADLTLLTHSLGEQFYIDENGELRGKVKGGKRAFNIELVRALMKSGNLQSKILVVPLKRGVEMLQTDQQFALFNLSRTVQREALFNWVGPLQREKDFFYELKTKPTHIKSIKDAKQVGSICVKNGSIHQDILVEKGFTNVNENISYLACLKMLENGRVDLAPLAASAVKTRSTQANVDINNISNTHVMLLDSEGYMAFSKSVPKETVYKWQNELDRLKENGQYQTLYELYYLTNQGPSTPHKVYSKQ